MISRTGHVFSGLLGFHVADVSQINVSVSKAFNSTPQASAAVAFQSVYCKNQP